MRALPCQQKLGVQLLKKDGGESIIQITVIHLHLQSRWCRVSASAGPEEDGFHVDLWDRSQAPSQGNYLEPTGHLMRFPMIYVALCTENIIRGTHIGLLLINFTLILPLDTFQYNIDNPDEQKLLALHGGKLKFQQLKHIEPSLRCFGKMSFLSSPPPPYCWGVSQHGKVLHQMSIMLPIPAPDDFTFCLPLSHGSSEVDADCLTAHLSNTHTHSRAPIAL